MKYCAGCCLVLCVALALSRDAAASEQDWVLVHEEPQHRLVFENERVKILDVRLPLGYTSLYHQHLLDMLYVTTSGSKVWAQPLNGTRREAVVATGDLRFSSDNHDLPHIHRVGNIGSQPFELIAVGVKPATGKAVDMPPVQGDLQGLEKVMEKPHASVYRITLKPGEKTGVHRHNLPFTEVYLSAAQRLDETGETTSIAPGEFRWQPGGISHRHENPGSRLIEIIEVQQR